MRVRATRRHAALIRDSKDLSHGIIESVTTAPVELERPDLASESLPDNPWVTIVWNDPINLMTYVTYVFMEYFKYPREKAEQLMHAVHEEGRAVVSAGSREEMERDVAAMHGYGLWATLTKDGA